MGKKYADFIIPEETKMNSSNSARLLVRLLSKKVIDVCMNSDNPWTIEPFHVRASLRKFGTWVKLDKITIPGGDIVGPDLNLENKEFIAVAEINNFEKIKLRCRIHHISQDPERIIRLDNWFDRLAEPVWEHEREELFNLNREQPRKSSLKDDQMKTELEKMKDWRTKREENLNLAA